MFSVIWMPGGLWFVLSGVASGIVAMKQPVEFAGAVERKRSSQPPTWRAPMKIWGTVRRLLRVIISSRLEGSISTRIFSKSETPLLCRRLSARMQYGQVPVAYMTIFAGMVTSSCDLPAVLPAAKPACRH